MCALMQANTFKVDGLGNRQQSGNWELNALKCDRQTNR